MSAFSCKHGNERYETCEDEGAELALTAVSGLKVVEKQVERSFHYE